MGRSAGGRGGCGAGQRRIAGVSEAFWRRAFSERLVAMTTKQNSFSRSDLNEELRLLLGAERGIQDAENMRSRLPMLGEHPAVVTQSPQTGGRVFQRGLESALKKALELSGEPAAMQKAVRWHIALDHGDVIQGSEAREKHACEIAGSKNLHKYSKDRPPGQQRPDLTIALESVEAQLEILGQASLGRPRVKVGDVEIPDILLLAACTQGRDATHEMTLEFEDKLRDERPPCAEWPTLRDYLLPELGAEAKAAGRKFLNGEMLDLVYAEDLQPDSGGPHHYRLGIAKTGYHRWAATANSLDRDLSRHRELTARLGSSELRPAWGHAPDCLEDLADLPAPCFMGVCVVVVAENQIVVLARQRKHYIAGSEPSSADRSRTPTPVHFVGEGVEPKDFVAGQNPFERAALRGCWEELELEAKDIELVPTAFVFDTLRWQPLFCYLAYCKLTMPEVEARMKEADDSYETGHGQIAKLLSPTVTDPDTRALLTGSHSSMRLASNHAETALLYALVYTDGLERVASETL
jgi:hypothetical protein